jgi:23S rRNA (cytidine1920-2'-O)/16S rRNA (cytidine1409-2'-O)-methyltransferase
MMAVAKQRLDLVLVARGMAESRQRAQAMVLAGDVLVDGQKAVKSGQGVDPNARLEIAARPKYVSRGGLKLEAALDHFHISVENKICVDVGASTGGFTDCLLQRGARHVYAVDVGTGQLDWRLRNDPRVILRERLNARHLNPEDIPEPVDLLVCDVSFISVTITLPPLVRLLRPEAEMVILVKPQFEVGRAQVGKGGIVRDPALHRAAVERVQTAVSKLGFTTEVIESPITGAEGNKEFLLYVARTPRSARVPPDPPPVKNAS